MHANIIQIRQKYLKDLFLISFTIVKCLLFISDVDHILFTNYLQAPEFC